MTTTQILGGALLAALFVGLMTVISLAGRRWWLGPATMLASLLMTGIVVLSVYLMLGSL